MADTVAAPSFNIDDAQKRIAESSGAAQAEFETFQNTLKRSTAIIQGSTDATVPALIMQQKTVNDELKTVTDAIAKQTNIASYPTFVGDVMGLFNDDWNWDVQNLRQRGAAAKTQTAVTNANLISNIHERQIQAASKDVELGARKLEAQRTMIGIIGETFQTLNAGDKLRYSRMSMSDLTAAAASGDATARAMLTSDKIQQAQLRNAVIAGDAAQLSYSMSALPDEALDKMKDDPRIGGAVKEALAKRAETRALKAAAIAQRSDEATGRFVNSLDIPDLEYLIKQGETTRSSFVTVGEGEKSFQVPMAKLREALPKVQENIKKADELRTQQGQAQTEAVMPIMNGGAALSRIYGPDPASWPSNVRNDWQKLNNTVIAAKGTDGLVSAAKEATKQLEELKKKTEGYRTPEGKKVIDDVFANGEVTDTQSSQGWVGEALVAPNFFYNNPTLHEIIKPFQSKALELQLRSMGMKEMQKNPDGSFKFDPAALFETFKQKMTPAQMYGAIANTTIDKQIVDPATGKVVSSYQSSLTNELENYYGKRAFEAALYKLGTEDNYFTKFLIASTGANGEVRPSGIKDAYTYGGKLDVVKVIKQAAYDQAVARANGQEVDYVNTVLTTLQNPDTGFTKNISSHMKATADLKEQALIQAMYSGRLESPILTYVRGIRNLAAVQIPAQKKLAEQDVKAADIKKELAKSVIQEQVPGVDVTPVAPGMINSEALRSQQRRAAQTPGTGPYGNN